MLTIVDTGALYALVDPSEKDHAAVVELFDRADLDLVIPALVVGEAGYLIGSRIGPDAEALFFKGLNEFEIESPAGDFPRIAELVEQYRDFPLGGTDASVIALAERLDTDLVATLDRHFGAVQPRHCPSFQLLPA